MTTNIANSSTPGDGETISSAPDLHLDQETANPRKPQAQSGLHLDRDPDLSIGIPIKVQPDQGASHDPRNYEARRAECIADCRLVIDGRMTRKALTEKYEGEYNSHRNMLKREKKMGREVVPEWRDFPRFLMSIGPRPSDEFTVDRLDNDDPTYGPGKVAWRNKKDQASNRSTSIHLSINGELLTVSAAAARYHVPADTIRDRKQKGWTDREAVYGKGGKAAKGDSSLPWPAQWEQDFQASGTNKCRFSWLRDGLHSQLCQLVKLIDPYEQTWEEGDPTAPAELPVDPPHILAARQRYEVLKKQWRRLMAIEAQRCHPQAFWHGFNKSELRERGLPDSWARGRARGVREDERSLDGFDYPPGWQDEDREDEAEGGQAAKAAVPAPPPPMHGRQLDMGEEPTFENGAPVYFPDPGPFEG